MTFKCTCEKARIDDIRTRLMNNSVRYLFYMKLWNRPVFEFDSEAEMIEAVVSTNGHLSIQCFDIPPKKVPGPLLETRKNSSGEGPASARDNPPHRRWRP